MAPLAAALTVAMAALMAGCGGDDGDGGDEWKGPAGSVTAWLATTSDTPLLEEYRVAGKVVATGQGSLGPPEGARVLLPGAPTSRTITIRDARGASWILGYEIRAGSPQADITPALDHLQEVELVARGRQDATSTDMAVILEDALGFLHLVFTVDVSRQWLEGGDVPGISVFVADAQTVIREPCLDRLIQQTVWIADPGMGLILLPGQMGTVTINRRPYTAVNAWGYRGVSVIRCPEVEPAGAAWAFWLRP